MINFFRRIRQKMLTENKFSKYLLYALGEIVLVVIGILIALSINNWNEKRKQIAYGKELMIELIEDVNKHISMLNWASENIKETISSQEKMFDIKDLHSVETASLYSFFAMANIDVKVLTNTYDKIKSQGLTRLSENDSLNKEINKYFDLYVTQYNKRIDYDLKNQSEREKYLLNHTLDFNTNKIQGFDKVNENEIKEDFITYLNLPRTKSIILQINRDSKSILNTLEKFKRQSIFLIEHLHKELSKTIPELEPLPDFGLEINKSKITPEQN